MSSDTKPNHDGRQHLLIAIDGPAASGKGTIAYLVARKYKMVNIDSGACYRALAWLVDQQHISPTEENIQDILALTKTQPITFIPNAHQTGPKSFIKVGSTDITDKIRTTAIAELASILGTFMPIRRFMFDYQRQLIKDSSMGIVIEGRDTGTVVAADADLKFFLTASIEVRAQRRHADYVDMGRSISFEEVYSEIAERDRRDTERAYSALRIADDAIMIDSSLNTIDMTVAQISTYIDDYLHKQKARK